MSGNGQIAAIRAVQSAAMKLTLACTEIVGPVEMAIAMPAATVLGEEIPPHLLRVVAKLNQKERKK